MENETVVKEVSRRALVFMAATMIVCSVRAVIVSRSVAATRHLHNAKHIVGLTAAHLDLNRSMCNFEIVFQRFGHRAQHVLAALYALLFYCDVAATTDHA